MPSYRQFIITVRETDTDLIQLFDTLTDRYMLNKVVKRLIKENKSAILNGLEGG